MKKSLLLLLIAFVSQVSAQSKRIYVSEQAPGFDDGSSWFDAFTDLQSALSLAQYGDTIWVAEGTYYPTATTDRTISFKVKNGVRLFGGFAGTETALDERDWQAHPVELSGNLGSFLLSTDNSLHVMTLESPDSNTVVDGFTFRYGNANLSGNGADGGGIFVLVPSTSGVSAARIRNCLFQLNWASDAGGAVQIFSQGADYSVFENCEFVSNEARVGGAVYVSATQMHTRFVECRFSFNKSNESGGAVALSDVFNATRIQSCYFEKNRTGSGNGGAIFSLGRTLAGKGPVIENCQFVENRCALNNASLNSQAGGAIYLWDMGGPDTFSVRNCQFTKNVSNNASAVYFRGQNTTGSNVAINRCTFEENGTNMGTVMVLSSTHARSVRLHDCHFKAHQQSVLVVSGGGLASPEQTRIIVDSCSFLNNKGSVFSAMVAGNNTHATLSNSLIKNNQTFSTLLHLFPKECFIRHCIFEQNEKMLNFWENESNTVYVQNCLFRKNHAFDFMFGTYDGVLNVLNSHFDSNVSAADYSTIWYSGQAFVKNSIFTNNRGVTLSNDSLISYTIPGYLKPHYEHCYFNGPLVNPLSNATFGPGNLTGVTPMFQQASIGDFRLSPCSPLVGAGDNTAAAAIPFDLNGQPRIQGGIVDIGVFERPPPALASPPQIQLPCPGDDVGSVTFDVTDGCEPYAFVWSSDAAMGQNLHDLPIGNYNFSVTDARGSSLVVPISIVEKPAPLLSAAVEPLVCGDTAGGSAVLSAVGDAPFVFEWEDGSIASERTGLAAGTYRLTVTDADGCIATDSVHIMQEGRLGAAVQVEPITCPGYSDGALTVAPTLGLAPFQWLWETGDTTESLVGLGAGTYRCTLSDALGCSIVWVIPLLEPTVDCGDGDGIFPNPFSDWLTIRTKRVPDAAAHWLLADVWGRVVFRAALPDPQARLHLGHLPAGIYFWQLWQGGQLTGKGVVERM